MKIMEAKDRRHETESIPTDAEYSIVQKLTEASNTDRSKQIGIKACDTRFTVHENKRLNTRRIEFNLTYPVTEKHGWAKYYTNQVREHLRKSGKRQRVLETKRPKEYDENDKFWRDNIPNPKALESLKK